jgi:hypothetical protein
MTHSTNSVQAEQRACKNCSQDFSIEPADFEYYKKIDVPAPTWCPACRLQRRMLFFNERALYKRACDLCRKEVVSAHHPDAPHPIYCQPCWWSDQWDSLQYGREYDFSRPFFEQFKELRDSFPLPSLTNIYTSNVNSEYCNMTSYLKNCYLLFNADYTEESAFSCYLERSKQCYDTDHADLCELCYDCTGLFKCYGVKYSTYVMESVDVLFSRDLHNCSHCFGCINLRNKKYCIFNEQKTKGEYEAEIAKYDLTSIETVNELKRKTEDFFLTQPRKFFNGVGNVNVSGDYLGWCKNLDHCYDMVGAEDCKYCHFFIIKGGRDCMDVTMWGGVLVQGFESMAIGGGNNTVKFSFECWAQATNLTYCSRIVAPNSNLFGCIGLRNKNYCILNKQYSKEEYESLIPKIIQQMKEMPYIDPRGHEYRYGEFFPPSFSLFGYNESVANQYLPITQEDAIKNGFRWADRQDRKYEIGGDVIACKHAGHCNQQCSTAFRLTKKESEYYQTHGIPKPELCSNCRFYERVKKRNPIKLWQRRCMCDHKIFKNSAGHEHHREGACHIEFETSYAPDRPEIVYCEACYNAEVT